MRLRFVLLLYCFTLYWKLLVIFCLPNVYQFVALLLCVIFERKLDLGCHLFFDLIFPLAVNVKIMTLWIVNRNGWFAMNHRVNDLILYLPLFKWVSHSLQIVHNVLARWLITVEKNCLLNKCNDIFQMRSSNTCCAITLSHLKFRPLSNWL